jgi:hypothetical protein
MKNKTQWLTFQTSMPPELESLYGFLQSELDWILTNQASRKILSGINLNQHHGNVWREMRDKYRYRVKTWSISNKAWRSYMLFENVRRLLESLSEKQAVYDCLAAHDMKSSVDLWDDLHAKNLYPTTGLIRNLIRSGVRPELPRHATFCMDYSISERQVFTMTPNGSCKIKTAEGDWIDWQILIPSSVRQNATGKISKPRFIMNGPIGSGQVSYEIAPVSAAGASILGVDIGKRYLYSAVALRPNGTVSPWFVNSRTINRMQEKERQLQVEKARLRAKESRRSCLGMSSPLLLEQCVGVGRKLTRVKAQACRVAADELVKLALELDCGEIHVEDLRWLESKAGKWDYSAFHSAISERCSVSGVGCVRVNAAGTSTSDPVTGACGKPVGRDIVFPDGSRVDRDRLAAVSIASRSKRGKARVVRTAPKGRATPRRVKNKSPRRRLVPVNHSTRGVGVVAFWPGVPPYGGAGFLVTTREKLQGSSLLGYQ